MGFTLDAQRDALSIAFGARVMSRDEEKIYCCTGERTPASSF